jgi:hypothetical protein
MGMKYPHPGKLRVLPDHFQNGPRILRVPDPHGTIDASLNGIEEEFGTFPGGIDELGLFPFEIKVGIDADTEGQKAYGKDDDPGCQTFEDQPASIE